MSEFYTLWIDVLMDKPEYWNLIIFWIAICFLGVFVFTLNTKYEKIVDDKPFSAIGLCVLLSALFPFLHIILLAVAILLFIEYIDRLIKEWK